MPLRHALARPAPARQNMGMKNFSKLCKNIAQSLAPAAPPLAASCAAALPAAAIACACAPVSPLAAAAIAALSLACAAKAGACAWQAFYYPGWRENLAAFWLAAKGQAPDPENGAALGAAGAKKLAQSALLRSDLAGACKAYLACPFDPDTPFSTNLLPSAKDPTGYEYPDIGFGDNPCPANAALPFRKALEIIAAKAPFALADPSAQLIAAKTLGYIRSFEESCALEACCAAPEPAGPSRPRRKGL